MHEVLDGVYTKSAGVKDFFGKANSWFKAAKPQVGAAAAAASPGAPAAAAATAAATTAGKWGLPKIPHVSNRGLMKANLAATGAVGGMTVLGQHQNNAALQDLSAGVSQVGQEAFEGNQAATAGYAQLDGLRQQIAQMNLQDQAKQWTRDHGAKPGVAGPGGWDMARAISWLQQLMQRFRRYRPDTGDGPAGAGDDGSVGLIDKRVRPVDYHSLYIGPVAAFENVPLPWDVILGSSKRAAGWGDSYNSVTGFNSKNPFKPQAPQAPSMGKLPALPSLAPLPGMNAKPAGGGAVEAPPKLGPPPIPTPVPRAPATSPGLPPSVPTSPAPVPGVRPGLPSAAPSAMNDLVNRYPTSIDQRMPGFVPRVGPQPIPNWQKPAAGTDTSRSFMPVSAPTMPSTIAPPPSPLVDIGPIGPGANNPFLPRAASEGAAAVPSPPLLPLPSGAGNLPTPALPSMGPSIAAPSPGRPPRPVRPLPPYPITNPIAAGDAQRPVQTTLPQPVTPRVVRRDTGSGLPKPAIPGPIPITTPSLTQSSQAAYVDPVASKPNFAGRGAETPTPEIVANKPDNATAMQALQAREVSEMTPEQRAKHNVDQERLLKWQAGAPERARIDDAQAEHNYRASLPVQNEGYIEHLRQAADNMASKTDRANAFMAGGSKGDRLTPMSRFSPLAGDAGNFRQLADVESQKRQEIDQRKTREYQDSVPKNRAARNEYLTTSPDLDPIKRNLIAKGTPESAITPEMLGNSQSRLNAQYTNYRKGLAGSGQEPMSLGDFTSAYQANPNDPAIVAARQAAMGRKSDSRQARRDARRGVRTKMSYFTQPIYVTDQASGVLASDGFRRR